MAHHSRGLRQLMQKEAQLADAQIDAVLNQLVADPLSADLSAADLAMLKYAILLTQSPGSVSQADVDQLRQHDFDDRAIHDLACCVGYFAFVNRIADGLGVQLEK